MEDRLDRWWNWGYNEYLVSLGKLFDQKTNSFNYSKKLTFNLVFVTKLGQIMSADSLYNKTYTFLKVKFLSNYVKLFQILAILGPFHCKVISSSFFQYLKITNIKIQMIINFGLIFYLNQIIQSFWFYIDLTVFNITCLFYCFKSFNFLVNLASIDF